LDILVPGSHPTFPGCVVGARPLGALEMRDEHGVDCKVLSVSCRDPRFAECRELSDMSAHFLREIEHFFRVYKDLEEKEVGVLGWVDLKQTHRIISECHHRITGKHQLPPQEAGMVTA
jgi:inorganic pyrophosphatase